MKTIDLICAVCQKSFVRALKQYKYQLKKSGSSYQPLCGSFECRKKFKFNRQTFNCDNCSTAFERNAGQIKKSEKHFCSQQCAAIFNNQQRKITVGTTKEIVCRYCPTVFIVKQSSSKKLCDSCQKVRKNIQRNPQPNKRNPLRKTPAYYNCIVCGIDIQSKGFKKKYCDACRHLAMVANGKRISALSVATQVRRSKNEILFATLCANEFSNVSTNEPFFVSKYGNWDADVILHDHKIAVLWNGIWHYKQVRKGHSLVQVQARDKIKLDVIKDNGYASYVIVDMGKHNPEFVKSEFEKFKTAIKTHH